MNYPKKRRAGEQIASDYAAKLLSIPVAAEKFGLGLRTLESMSAEWLRLTHSNLDPSAFK